MRCSQGLKASQTTKKWNERGTKKLLCFLSWSGRKSSTVLKTVHPHLWTNLSIWTELGLLIWLLSVQDNLLKTYPMISPWHGITQDESKPSGCLPCPLMHELNFVGIKWTFAILSAENLCTSICDILNEALKKLKWTSSETYKSRCWELKSCGLVIGIRIRRVNLHIIQCFLHYKTKTRNRNQICKWRKILDICIKICHEVL